MHLLFCLCLVWGGWMNRFVLDVWMLIIWYMLFSRWKSLPQFSRCCWARVCPVTAAYRRTKARESLSKIWKRSTMCLPSIRYCRVSLKNVRLWKDGLCGCISRWYFCVFGRNVTLRSTKFSWCLCVPSRCHFLLLNFSWMFQQLQRNSVAS